MAKKDRFVTSATSLAARKRDFFEFFLCLSRACLGKMLIFIYKWLKKCRFRTCFAALFNPTFQRIGDGGREEVAFPPARNLSEKTACLSFL
jgi:hypothetical protein